MYVLCMHVIRKNKFQMIIYVCVAFNHLPQSIAVLELQFLRFGIENSGRHGQIVNQPKLKRNRKMNKNEIEHSFLLPGIRDESSSMTICSNETLLIQDVQNNRLTNAQSSHVEYARKLCPTVHYSS